MSEIEKTIEWMRRASEVLRVSIEVNREMLAEMDSQRARMLVVRGYLLAGRPDLAAMVLAGEPGERGGV